MSEDLIRIGDLSHVTGVPIATLRYYESEGLIMCVRTRSKYRMFPKETVDVVMRILHLKSLKIPLAEIRRIFSTDDSPQATREYYLELQQRLAHILERKSLWEEEENKVRQLLEAFPTEEVGDEEHV